MLPPRSTQTSAVWTIKEFSDLLVWVYNAALVQDLLLPTSPLQVSFNMGYWSQLQFMVTRSHKSIGAVVGCWPFHISTMLEETQVESHYHCVQILSQDI